MEVFPLPNPWFGSYDETTQPSNIEVYADGTYRHYVAPGAVPVRYMSLYFEQLSTSDKNALSAFFAARKNPLDPDGGLFLLNDWSAYPGNVLVGNEGTQETGALLGIFLDDALTFSEDGPCMWSVTTSHISGTDQSGSGSGVNILIVQSQ